MVRFKNFALASSDTGTAVVTQESVSRAALRTATLKSLPDVCNLSGASEYRLPLGQTNEGLRAKHRFPLH